jgi:hypothetical protein
MAEARVTLERPWRRAQGNPNGKLVALCLVMQRPLHSRLRPDIVAGCGAMRLSQVRKLSNHALARAARGVGIADRSSTLTGSPWRAKRRGRV